MQIYDNGQNMTEMFYNESASNGTHSMSSIPNDPIMRCIMVITLFVTFVFGITGNGLVIYIIAYFTKVREKSVANYYIWNLAFADELFVLALPLFCYSTYTQQWPFAETWFGDVSCKSAYLLLFMNKFASVFTLVALSADRYLASYHRLAYLRTIQVGKLTCVCVWILCFIICIPILMYTRIKRTSSNTTSCSTDWPEPSLSYQTFWTYFMFFAGLLIPFTMIALSYVMLLRRFRALVRLQKKSGRRMTQTVIVVVVTFLICQAPYHVLNFIHLSKAEHYEKNAGDGRPSVEEVRLYGYLNGISQILVFISSCCNPIIYALFNENFSKYKTLWYHFKLYTKKAYVYHQWE